MDIRFEKIPTNHQALKDYSSKLRLFTLKQQERLAELEKERDEANCHAYYILETCVVFSPAKFEAHNLEQTRKGFWLGFEDAKCHPDEMNILAQWEGTKAFSQAKALKETK